MSSAHHDGSSPPTGRRIAVIVRSFSRDDASRVAAERVRWFADAGYDVSVVMVASGRTPAAAGLPASVASYSLAAVAGRSAQAQRLRSILSEHRFDIVLSLQTDPNLLVVEATRDLEPRPLVVLTELQPLSSGVAHPGLAAKLRVRRAQRAYRHADLVVSSSHPIGAELSAAFGVSASRSLVVPDPVLPRSPERVPRAPGTSAGVQLVLATPPVASARPHLAVLAARELQSRGIHADVVAFGEGPLGKELAALARRSGVALTFRDQLDDWPSQLAPNAVVLFAERSSGLGRVLVEAAAHGVPSVAVSTALGVADGLIPGITGELAFDDSPAAIADAVEAASHLDVTGVDTWLARFSPGDSGAVLERAIDDAAARRAAA